MTAEKNLPQRFIYLHGFNSSPASAKAQQFSQYFRQYFGEKSEPDLIIPAIPYDPVKAVAEFEALVSEVDQCFLAGSSLGGYYATYLVEKYGGKAALINPAIAPARHLDEGFLGTHVNYHTGEEYELTRAHVEYMGGLEREVLKYPENYLLLVQTDDELLDYRLAVEKYAGARQIVQQGGNHSFENFTKVLPEIFKFAMA